MKWLRTLVVSPFALLFAIALAAQEFPQDRALPDGIDVARSIAYATYGERTLLLDLYTPSQRSDVLIPAIVAIRGGGWLEGDREYFGYIAAALAEREFAAVSIEYRAAGEAPFPAAVEDTKAAVRWLRANAGRYGLNPNAIGAIGGSAGAHLALLLGTTAGVPELEGDGGNPGYSSAISAIVAMAPAARLEPDWPNAEQWIGAPYEEAPELWESAAPLRYVSHSSPPLLLIHGVRDGIVRFDEHSLALAARYGEVAAPVEVVLLPDMSHAFWASSWERFRESMDRAAVFFRRYVTGPRR